MIIFLIKFLYFLYNDIFYLAFLKLYFRKIIIRDYHTSFSKQLNHIFTNISYSK